MPLYPTRGQWLPSRSCLSEQSQRVTPKLAGTIFNPMWAYLACSEPGSTARHSFFCLSQHAVRDAPPWVSGLRKVGKDRRKRDKSAPGGIRTYYLMITRRVLFRCAITAALTKVIILYNCEFLFSSCSRMRGRPVLLQHLQVQPDQLHLEPLQVRQGEGLHRWIGRTELQ